jgi:hypothetical protein
LNVRILLSLANQLALAMAEMGQNRKVTTTMADGGSASNSGHLLAARSMTP